MLESPAVANIRSQIKRNRQNERRRERNRAARTRLKTEARRTREAVEAGDAEAARERLRKTVQAIDRAVSSGALNKHTAARRKSRLAKQVAALESD